MGPSQICGCPFREPRVFTIAHLVGGLEHLDYFSIQLGVSSSQLTFIFFRGVAHPPTRFYGRYNHFMGYRGNMGKIMGKLEIWGNKQSTDDAPGDLMKPML